MVEVKERGCWRRHPNASPGFLLFPRYPRLVLSFPGGTWAVKSPKDVSSEKASQEWLGCSCFVPPGQTSREAELYFYLTRALWREKWTFALHVCDTALLNCFLSKVRVSQGETLPANQKALDKYTWVKGSIWLYKSCISNIYILNLIEQSKTK